MLQDERTILRLLQQRPHPHIIEAIDTDYAEGIHLREYQPLSEDKIPTQPHRIRWYRDLTNALCHIHSLGIAHADVLFERKESTIVLKTSLPMSANHNFRLAAKLGGRSREPSLLQL